MYANFKAKCHLCKKANRNCAQVFLNGQRNSLKQTKWRRLASFHLDALDVSVLSKKANSRRKWLKEKVQRKLKLKRGKKPETRNKSKWHQSLEHDMECKNERHLRQATILCSTIKKYSALLTKFEIELRSVCGGGNQCTTMRSHSCHALVALVLPFSNMPYIRVKQIIVYNFALYTLKREVGG